MTLTLNEIMTALNTPSGFILALVLVDGAQGRLPRYVRRYPFKEPGAGVTSANYNLNEPLAIGEAPA